MCQFMRPSLSLKIYDKTLPQNHTSNVWEQSSTLFENPLRIHVCSCLGSVWPSKELLVSFWDVTQRTSERTTTRETPYYVAQKSTLGKSHTSQSVSSAVCEWKSKQLKQRHPRNPILTFTCTKTYHEYPNSLRGKCRPEHDQHRADGKHRGCGTCAQSSLRQVPGNMGGKR